MKKFLAAFLTICFIIAIGVSAVNLEQVEEIAEPAVPADAEQTSEALLNEQIIPGSISLPEQPNRMISKMIRRFRLLQA